MSEENTAPVPDKPRKPGVFTKNDPRINRTGAPRVYFELRRLATEFGKQKTKENKTRVMDALERVWRDNPEKFLEYHFGKEPEEINLNPYGDAVNLTINVVQVEG